MEGEVNKVIDVRDLHYTYPGAHQKVLHGLNFTIEDQEIFGFLGPSGAGKSTTQKILIGLLKNYQGSITVLGRELSAWDNAFYEQIGVSFELPNHYLKLTALENLSYFRSLYQGPGPTPDPMEILASVGLADDADKRVAKFSKGMKIRLNVARSLLYRPKLLFLDEPTSGLDPVNARNIKNLILEQRARGTTVFVTSHDMTVADELCDRVAFIANGRIDVIDAPRALKKEYGKRSVVVEYTDDTTETQSREFPLDNLGQNGAYFDLLNAGNRIETIHTQETTLEQVFIKVTGQELSK
jgi:fluoroquinolone transport system ATP-binding protein